jgi:hypothetical protein
MNLKIAFAALGTSFLTACGTVGGAGNVSMDVGFCPDCFAKGVDKVMDDTVAQLTPPAPVETGSLPDAPAR